MSLTTLLAGAALGTLALPQIAKAADMLKALPAPAYDWSGFYVGAHAGYLRGHSNATLLDPAFTAQVSNGSGGITAGAQAGYNWLTRSGVLFGLEADISFPSYLPANAVLAEFSGTPSQQQHLDFYGSVRARLGIAAGRWLPYVTGGLAYAHERYLTDPESDKALSGRIGWVAGAGLEYGFTPHWSARIEYLYSDYQRASVALPGGGRFDSALSLQTIRVGLNRRLDWLGTGDAAPFAAVADPESDRWEIHGQTTVVGQGYPSFRSPYDGANSLAPNSQFKTTWSSSLFANVRLWDGGELYLNPEFLQGYGLSDTVGVAGFPNGEGQKSGFAYPHFSPSRFYLRQTFGLGGEQEQLASSASQLSGKADISRLTFQVGRFSVVDVFDGNSYAHDPRRDFMNWSIWASGAFDYAADKLGLTYGATAELNQKQWAIRAGYFLMDAESNSNNFDTKLLRRGEYVAELETRYTLFGQPGKLRTLGFINSVYSGSYRETLDNPLLNLDISQTRKGRIKYGYTFNLEQAVTEDVGVFGRWSWNDGRNEIMSFTDIDDSFSGGVSIRGLRWGRPDDVIGIAGATNGLSRDHRDFLAAGGLGPLIGDGRLNYRRENILEAYYAYAVTPAWTATADYQFIANPAFNADRGPVSVFSGRLHGEF
ncbi:carbohydrate porin [Rhodopseudomonas telluris]|uniref:Carbohydrate porin n=1 Tax=Rhodopseudomonas telluris TaxID=644215 RepID=A0ABV6EQ43_9BRAD